jgi:hypothetical protein
MSKISYRSHDVFKYSRCKKMYDNWDVIDVPENGKDEWVIKGKKFIPKQIIHDLLSKAQMIDVANDLAEVPINYKYSQLLKVVNLL